MSTPNDPTAIMNAAQQAIAQERADKSEPTPVLHVYWATLPSINYIFPNGRPAIFVNGRFTTNIPYEIDQLDYEIKMGHPHIYKKKGEETMDAKYLDPMQGFKERILAEAVAQGLITLVDPNRDMGTSKQGPLNVANTGNISQAASGGSGATTPAAHLSPALAGLAALHHKAPVSEPSPAPANPTLPGPL